MAIIRKDQPTIYSYYGLVDTSGVKPQPPRKRVVGNPTNRGSKGSDSNRFRKPDPSLDYDPMAISWGNGLVSKDR